jgi:hypothetical protein
VADVRLLPAYGLFEGGDLVCELFFSGNETGDPFVFLTGSGFLFATALEGLLVIGDGDL